MCVFLWVGNFLSFPLMVLESCAFGNTSTVNSAVILVSLFPFPYFMHSAYGTLHILLPISGRWQKLEGRVTIALPLLCSWFTYNIVIGTEYSILHFVWQTFESAVILDYPLLFEVISSILYLFLLVQLCRSCDLKCAHMTVSFMFHVVLFWYWDVLWNTVLHS